MHTIFSIKRPRCLFQTHPGGPGVYSNHVVNLSSIFIKKVFLFIIFDKHVSGFYTYSLWYLKNNTRAYFQLQLRDPAFNRENTVHMKQNHT